MTQRKASGGDITGTLPRKLIEQLAPAAPPKRRVVLLVYHRDGVEVVPLLPGAPVVVGRSAPADVVIADECLSRSHARFTLSEGEAVAVEDLGSLNRTWVGGEPVERASIKPGEQVMLGTVPAAVHVFAGDEAPPLGLEGHDTFLAGVEAEIARSRFFGRSLAVLVVQAGAREKDLLPRWCPRVRQLLRPVDRIGFYGAGVVEILRPESGLEEALSLARSIVARHEGEPALVCGVATFPETGASAGTLLSAARDAARSARPGEPLRAAASALATVLTDARPTAEAGDIILQSPPMRALAETARRVARARLPVLLHGETGSGKEVVAQLIHASGPRRSGPLVCVNCAAIPPTLVESTLFGHVKGSFTGAISDRKGVFEEADGGTLLLDEIGELPAAAQAALLRVLETQRVSRVGSAREIPVNVRVIAATHRDLETMSKTGAFRQDLFFRLNAAEVSIPPLRERRDDIPLLAARFLSREIEAAGRGPMTIDAEALALMERYAWPGNVRELRNAIERAVAIADAEVITPRDLPERVRSSAMKRDPAPVVAAARSAAEEPAPTAALHTGTLKERMSAFERETLIAALREAGGHQGAAARLLDMPLRTLQFKIKHHHITKQYSAADA